MNITGKTKVFGILGWPVEHSLSPSMHNAAFKKLKLDCCYVCFPVSPENLKYAVTAIRALNIAGVNVTVPHKENVISFLDEVSEEAAFIGAVNTIANKNNKLIGYNTDGKGFMKSLSESKISLKNKSVLVIGAGGASRAICFYLAQKAESLALCDIDKNKSDKLASDLKKINPNANSINKISSADEFDIIINSTPLGLKKNDLFPINKSLLKPKHIVCDLIYKKTKLLETASQKNCKTMSGLGMLLWQGVFAFEIWTGKRPPVNIMRGVLLKNADNRV